jgi:hypothetical protein
MKKILFLSMLIPFTIICSCQKQDSAAEQQLAQRETELDTRENALDEREKGLAVRETALKERENALAKKEKAAANLRTIPPDVQSHDAIRDAAQAKAERDRRIQQLPPEIRALIPDPSQMSSARAEKDRMTRERLAQRQAAQEESRSQKQDKLGEAPKAWMSGASVYPSLEAASPTPSPAADAAFPTQSPTPE